MIRDSPVHRLASLRTATVLALLLAAGALLSAAPASAAPAPHWTITSAVSPTHLPPGETLGLPIYIVTAINTGGAATDGSTITITDELPTGVTVDESTTALAGRFALFKDAGFASEAICEPGPPATCSVSGLVVHPGMVLNMEIPVNVEASAPDPAINQVTVHGGGAPDASVTEQRPVTSDPVPPGLQSMELLLGDTAGTPATQAGSHPELFRFGFQLNTELDLEFHGSRPYGTLKDIHTVLPPGVVVDPQATPIRCTEAQLEIGESVDACPTASAVGLINPILGFVHWADPIGSSTPLYNIVPPRGAPASFGANIGGLGFYIHLVGGVDSANEYALTADTRSVTGRALLLGSGVTLWGDPSDPSHDFRRGKCGYPFGIFIAGGCPVEKTDTPLLTVPTACGAPLSTSVSVDTYQEPSNFVGASALTTDELGDPVGVTGCNLLDFSPSLEARPTTSVADSPSGLSVDLHVPQTESLETLATAHLKDAVVTLPEGLTLNPSAANGLAGCSSSEIGLTTPIGQAPIHFTAEPASCPDVAKIGSVEIDTPLLDHPLPGAVYLAKPFDNPFGSLLAIYIAVADPKTGVVVKLAGQVQADRQTGQLTTTFENNPQMPFEDLKLNLFGGAGGTLRTPATCGTYETTSSLTPWSAPDSGPPATPNDSWAINQAPTGSCPTSQDAQPNSPSFDAGTVTPVAGAYSPFVLNLHRADDSQQFSSVTVTSPPGLVGKLAGTPACPEAALQAAAEKSGHEEEANPSCPAASAVGTVHAAAGAGPAPYNTNGTAYLTGPYKGAPIGLAIITPATAGPFDLGTVVVRAALEIDPATAQITASSDPIPSILQGIPLDIRSVQLRLDKPGFTLNGTSCDPLAVNGQLSSTLGQVAALSVPFQLGECASLSFKPKLALALSGGTRRGAHPGIKAILRMPEGGANIARAAVALPRSEFLDQGHINTVCTRTQYAAHECPAGSLLGRATAITPLLDKPLSGPVYLMSGFGHELPDLFADLNGQIHVTLDGRIDSIKGGIRTTFEAVPDAPVSKFVLEMQGGRKGLLQNSTDVCKGIHRATALFDAQNGKIRDLEPALRNAKCPRHPRKGSRQHKRGRAPR